MSTLREAAQQALEALKSVRDHRPNDETNAAVTALRAALAQQEQEQEPVAWMITTKDGRHFIFRMNKPATSDGETLTPLYAQPPRREWQSLSEQERHRLWRKLGEGEGIDEYAEAIEQALKEKNND
jgi:hypothetical protein